MTKQWVLASNNQGKLAEFAHMFADYQVEILPQGHWQVADADETGLSFLENAIIKARHACQLTGLPAIADDSGLVVDALGGQPGIYSSRYAGPNATDSANLEKLLNAMENVPAVDRTARFMCVLVFMQHANDPTPIIAQGHWQGMISTQVIGASGFGYDPIFYSPQAGKQAAQMSKTEKAQYSHRGHALRALLPQLEVYLD